MNQAAQEIIGVTQKFCARMAVAQFSDLPKKAVDEGRRGVLDWLGCALAGSRHPTLDRLLLVLQECGGKPQATVFGRSLKLGFLDAPIANGQADKHQGHESIRVLYFDISDFLTFCL